MLTAQTLFDFALSHAEHSVAQGSGMQFPTVVDCAKALKTTPRRISEIVRSGLPGKYLGLGVALHAGSGMCALKRNDQLVEAIL